MAGGRLSCEAPLDVGYGWMAGAPRTIHDLFGRRLAQGMTARQCALPRSKGVGLGNPSWT